MKKELFHQIANAIMKISVVPSLLSMIALCCYANGSNGQHFLDKKITLKMEQKEIRDVFAAIEKVTEVKFVYSPELIDATRKVDVDVKKKELGTVLTTILGPLDLNYELINSYIILRKNTATPEARNTGQMNMTGLAEDPAAKGIRISGKVTSSNGQPLEGVTVLVKNTSNGTSTNAAGEFTINVDNAQAVLVFSYIGFQDTEIPVGRKTRLEIKLLSNNEQLNDVVVIGYGTQKKVSVTGAISTVGGKEIKAVPSPDISNSLVGRLTGVIAQNGSGEPGYDGSTILIRGLSTMGNSSPLIVIDGVADRTGGFAHLDANDIESVTVLKDASAAIYGSRSANGVLLITTKRGASGKPTVNYTFNYGLRQPTRLPKMLDATTYAQAFNEIEENVYGRPARYTAQDIKEFADGSDPWGHPNTNWAKVTLKPVTGQYQQNVSISGGSDKVKYYMSVGTQYQDGYYRNGATNYKQYNVRSNIDAQVTTNFKMFLNIAARQENRSYPYTGSGGIFLYTTSGVPTALAYLPHTNLPAGPLGGDTNPVDAVTSSQGYQDDNRTYINGDIGFTEEMPYITKGLSVTGGLYIDKSATFFKSYYKNHILYNTDANHDTIPVVYGPGNASLNENMAQDLGITENIRLNYARKFGDHDISAFVAYEQYNYRYDYLYGSRSDYVTSVVDELFAGANDALKDNNGNAIETARQNYFGRVGYGFKDKYLFQFNWRYDGSVNFPANKRFGFFPGVSAGWRLSEENFMKEITWVNNLKLRASYGQLGNDNIAPFQYESVYTLGSGGVLGGPNAVLGTAVQTNVLPNPNVTWERAATYNLGLDGTLFDHAIDMTLEGFYTKRTDILYAANNSVPQYLGLSLPSQNIASADNKGFEASITYHGKIGQVDFSVGGNFTYNRSKVLNIQEAANIPAWQKATGKPIDALTTTKADGTPWTLMQAIGIYRTAADLAKYPHLANAQLGDLIFKDVNGDGVIDANDEVRPTETPTPKIVYGIPVNVNYKNWSFNMLWQGQAMSRAYLYFNSGEIGNFTQEYYDNHWTPAKPNATGPRLYDRETISSTEFLNSYFNRSSAFVRLKSLQIAYNLPRKLLRSLPFSNFQIYANGFNLLTFDKLKVIDPEEIPAGGTGNNYAAWYTPQTRVFNFGLNVNF